MVWRSELPVGDGAKRKTNKKKEMKPNCYVSHTQSHGQSMINVRTARQGEQPAVANQESHPRMHSRTWLPDLARLTIRRGV